MCLYWKKMHTCGDLSDRPYIEMCRPGYLSNTVCLDISDDSVPRHSHFPCYPCIKTEARSEIEAKAREEHEAIAKAKEARDRAQKEQAAAELRAKEERVRREARDKAAREREEELRVKREREEQERRAKKEGGLWIETSSGKKGKGRKGNGSTTGFSASPVLKTVTAPREKKENINANENNKMSPKAERSVDPGGRAGTWGPKKILSRKENNAGGGLGSGAAVAKK